MRKTANVQELKEFANIHLARTDEWATMEYKQGICVMLHHILHLSGSYKGFRFLDANDCEIDTLGHASRHYY